MAGETTLTNELFMGDMPELDFHFPDMYKTDEEDGFPNLFNYGSENHDLSMKMLSEINDGNNALSSISISNSNSNLNLNLNSASNANSISNTTPNADSSSSLSPGPSPQGEGGLTGQEENNYSTNPGEGPSHNLDSVPSTTSTALSNSKQTRKKWRETEDIAFLTVILSQKQLLTNVEYFKPMKRFWIKISQILRERYAFIRNFRQCHDRFKILYAKALRVQKNASLSLDEDEMGSISPEMRQLLSQAIKVFGYHNGNIVLKSHLTVDGASLSNGQLSMDNFSLKQMDPLSMPPIHNINVPQSTGHMPLGDSASRAPSMRRVSVSMPFSSPESPTAAPQFLGALPSNQQYQPVDPQVRTVLNNMQTMYKVIESLKDRVASLQGQVNSLQTEVTRLHRSKVKQEKRIHHLISIIQSTSYDT